MEEPDLPYPPQNDYRKAKWIAIVGICIFAVVGGMVVFKQKPQKIEVQKVQAVKYKQLPNTPTEKPVKAKKDITIQVLNGTGIPGQAAGIVKALIAAGYVTDNIKSGNADTSDHAITSITANADFGTVVEDIKDVLKPIVSDVSNGVPNLNPNVDSGFDVEIITGTSAANLTEK
jgi:hypothetical protein